MERGESNSRHPLLLALKKVQDHVVEKVLRRALDSDFNFSGNRSLPETLAVGELIYRESPRIFWQTVQDQPPVQLIRTRCIRIPVEDEPVLGTFTFQIKHLTKLARRRVGQYRKLMKARPTFEEVYSEERGKNRVAIEIWANLPHWRNSEDEEASSGGNAPVNKWYRDLIQAFHQYTYDPADTTCVWRGDLYILQTRTRDDEDALGLDMIEKDEMMEVVQKCRDTLADKWVCSF